jgi:hypothetical protein
MRKKNRNRTAFHPDLNGAGLEERLVLSLPPGFNFVTPQQAAQFRGAFSRVFRATEFGVRTQIQAQARQLFASGTPTAQQIASFEANADGAIVAGTSAIANMFALLPGAQRRLVPSTARMLLANSQNSLMSRVHNLVTNTNVTSALPSLESALRQNVRSSFGNVGVQAAQFLANQNLNSVVLNASDGSQSLPQFLGDRIISQFANNLGNLAAAFPTVANSVLFANGATTASPATVQQFNQMTTSALALAAFNLGNELQLLPSASSIAPALQNSFFGTSTGATGTTGTTGSTATIPASLFTALQTLPTTSTDFASALPAAFSTAFSNITGILSPFVGTFPTPIFAMPSTITAGVFSPTFTGNTFQSGFLGGFGSGSAGFGMAPTALNTNFGTGFNSFVSMANPALGFITPPISVSTGTGTGTGVVGTIGVTTGTGTTGTGTGTSGGATGTGTTGGTTGTGA